jgi:AcrR family transcriptional regulator
MTTTSSRHRAKRSAARERLLTTASQLFYAEGIASVGVDRIVSEGHVTLATFYRHFPSKEDLVVSYLDGVHELIAEQLASSMSEARGEDRVRAVCDQVISELGRTGFRGCAFTNAASEFEDPEHPVRRVIARHRQWYYELVRRAFAEAGHQTPGNAARHFVMFRDGAMIAGSLDSPTSAKRTFNRGVEGLIRSIETGPLTDAVDSDAA